MLKQTLNNITNGSVLSELEAYELMMNIAKTEYSNVQFSAFLMAFNMREIHLNELLGFRKAMLELSVKPNIPTDVIDLCGTGGDGKDTFNISTLSAFVVAGAGYKVAKHGNYGVSSICGSSNMLELLGYQFTTESSVLNKQLDKANLCFVHAPLFHPAMKKMAPIRKALGMKTIFNLLGPLVNPSTPKNQLVGVYKHDLLSLYQHALTNSNTNYSIVHSVDGYDEISLTGEYKVHRNHKTELMNPNDLFEQVNPVDIIGGTSLELNKEIFLSILKGNGTKAQNQVVLANSSLAIQTLKPNSTINSCIDEARYSLESGNAFKTLQTLIN